MSGRNRRALNSMRLGCYDEAAQFCLESLEREPGDDEALHVLGVIAIQQGRLEDALGHFKQAQSINPDNAGHCLNLGNVYRALGDASAAINAYRQALQNDPDNLAAWNGWAYTSMPGEPYTEVLRKFHAWQRPAVYLEIGIESGRTLAMARPPTRAIGVDPQPRTEYEFQADTSIFQNTSDAFFATHDVAEEFGQVELAFLDGSHIFEQTLREFRFVEAEASAEGVVLIHDCLPLSPLMAEKHRRTRFWTGDTWKVIPALTQFRPDLEVFTVATPPTGLAVVTRLDPESTVLKERQDEIMDAWLDRDFPESVSARDEELRVIPNDFAAIRRRIEAARKR